MGCICCGSCHSTNLGKNDCTTHVSEHDHLLVSDTKRFNNGYGI